MVVDQRFSLGENLLKMRNRKFDISYLSYKHPGILVGCSTGCCSTIQNGVSSTGRKTRFLRKNIFIVETDIITI
jgi:hypothetical protein